MDAVLQRDSVARFGDARVRATNEYEHEGIGDERVFTRLQHLVRDTGGGITGD
ncbi:MULTISPECIES: hypothetical protein [unclassified Streptomyces]|uniref:hypothetical protein n=1 Tax=unclassified Streptomyces TaxID=2593676 RepID=UPI002E0FCFEA|nr:hypothetical protein OG452_30690 [Streptomyces sp. NBC_01197]WSS47900.1 hypothetical protein OG708_04170 [Streptomyces sp. NBC_01180]